MFYCKKCGLVKEGTKQIQVATKIRKVKYQFRNIYLYKKVDEKTGILNMIESEPKLIKETEGFEIVEQDIYCSNCEVKDIKPEIIGEVIRVIDTKLQKREEYIED